MAQTHQDHVFGRNDTNPDGTVDTGRWADPETLSRLSNYPCFACLSDKQLWIVAVLILCNILAQDPASECTVEQLMQDSACINCFSERQIWQALLAYIAEWATDNGYITDVDTLIREAVCLNCVSAKQLKGMVAATVGAGLLNGNLFPQTP